jgi:hypothetical protein
MLPFSQSRLTRLVATAMILAAASYLAPAVEAQESLAASAWNITETPGAAGLAVKYPMKENDSPMRFEYLASGRAGEWTTLDLKTGRIPLTVQAREGEVTVTLPNGGKCVITAKAKEAYVLTFSDPDVGLSKSIPTAHGDRILLGSPQNNANDAQFVLIELKPVAAQGKP